jgi:hypothetical protein
VSPGIWKEPLYMIWRPYPGFRRAGGGIVENVMVEGVTP